MSEQFEHTGDTDAGPGAPSEPADSPAGGAPADGVPAGSAQPGPGAGEPGVAEGQGSASGAYVPPRTGSRPSATPAADGPAEAVSTEPGTGDVERSKERIAAAQAGRTVPTESGQEQLDLGQDAAYADPDRDKVIAQQSRHLVTQGIANTQGSVTFGDHSPAMTQTVSVVVGERRVRVVMGTYDPDQLDRIRHPHVRVDGFVRILDTLRQQRVVVLRGPHGSGRRATAVNLLTELNLSRISTLSPGPDATLHDVGSESLFQRGHGYVLEIENGVVSQTLDAFPGLLADCGAHLVIVTAAEQHGDVLHMNTFRHRAAPADQVLTEHLVSALARHRCDVNCTEQSRAAYVKSRLSDIDALVEYTLPVNRWELVDLAYRIANGLHDGIATEILVKRDRAELRRVASAALTVEDDGVRPEAVRQQAFRIAYAVFNECSLADVIKAGDLFSKVLPLFETREKQPDHVAFDGRIEHLLAKGMQTEASGTADDGDAGPRRAVLADPALTGTFLDVVWNDFDALRVPVLVWLDLLAGWDRPPLQIRAAHAAGLLATFDFDELYRSLIGVWARGALVYRQSAANALHVTSGDRRLTERIRRQVQDWADSPNPRLQDTAARAYGRLVGVDDHPAGIRALRALGSKSSLAGTRSIAIGMANLFNVGPQQVLEELARWNSGADPNLRRHASRALMLLTRLAGPGARHGWPAMSSLVAGSSSLERQLAEMWAGALLGNDTARRAWEPLRIWIMAADREPELTDLVLRLSAHIFSGVDERAIFHLVHWRHRFPESATLQRVHEAVLTSRTRSHDQRS